MVSLLGARIRQARKAAGMTQVQLAADLNISTSYLCDIEQGHRLISADRLFDICNRFPDEDSAEWLWLKLADDWGQPVADVMRRYAQAAQQQPADAAGAVEE